MSKRVSHDQNFKNQILDYPLQAVAFYAPEEAQALDQKPRVIAVRQEQLKDRLGDRFREMDTPLLLEWPNGERAAIIFAFEHESQSGRFSIHRLAHYSLDISAFYKTNRVVPVTVFQNPAPHAETELKMGSETQTYLEFRYIQCVLNRMEASAHYQSTNIIARMNLPLMNYPDDQKLEVFHHAIQGLITLESDPEKQAKYADWVDIYSQLDDNEIREYAERYPQEVQVMAGFAQRYRDEGRQEGEDVGFGKGWQKGRQEGQAQTLLKLIQLKFGTPPSWVEDKLNEADKTQLDQWVADILTADSLDELFA